MSAPEPIAPEDEWIPPLDAYLADVDAPPEAGDDPSGGRAWADRQLGRLRRLNDEFETANATADQRIDEINGWRKLVTDRLMNRMDEIRVQLEGFMRAEAETSGIKTLSLPNGDLKLRGGPENRQYYKVIVAGVEDYVAARAMQFSPELTKVEHSIRKNAVKQITEPGTELSSEEARKAMEKVADPTGYKVHTAVFPSTGALLPGVYLFVPERETFSAKPKEESL